MSFIFFLFFTLFLCCCLLFFHDWCMIVVGSVSLSSGSFNKA